MSKVLLDNEQVSILHRYVKNLESENHAYKTMPIDLRRIDEGKKLFFDLDASHISSFGSNDHSCLSTPLLSNMFNVYQKLPDLPVKMTIHPLHSLEVHLNNFRRIFPGQPISALKNLLVEIENGKDIPALLEKIFHKHHQSENISFLKNLEGTFWNTIKRARDSGGLIDFADTLESEYRWQRCPFWMNNREYDASGLLARLIVFMNKNPVNVHVWIDTEMVKSLVLINGFFAKNGYHYCSTTALGRTLANKAILRNSRSYSEQDLARLIPSRTLATPNLLVLSMGAFGVQLNDLRKFFENALKVSDSLMSELNKRDLTSIRLSVIAENKGSLSLDNTILNLIDKYENETVKELGARVDDALDLELESSGDISKFTVTNSLKDRIKISHQAIKSIQRYGRVLSEEEIIEDGKYAGSTGPYPDGWDSVTEISNFVYSAGL